MTQPFDFVRFADLPPGSLAYQPADSVNLLSGLIGGTTIAELVGSMSQSAAIAGTSTVPMRVAPVVLKAAILAHSPPMTDAQTLQGASLAQVRDRETHTGTQAIATVTGLQAALDGKQAASVELTGLVAGIPASYPSDRAAVPVRVGDGTWTAVVASGLGLALMAAPDVVQARSALGLATVASAGTYASLTARPAEMTQAVAVAGTSTDMSLVSAAVVRAAVLAHAPGTTDAGALTSGILPNLRLPERLRERPPQQGVDLDTLLDSGFYFCSSSSTNMPPGVAYGWVFVQGYSSASTIQYYTPWNSDAIYFRRRALNAWGAWKPIAFGSDIGTNGRGNRYVGTSATPPAGTYNDGDIYMQL